VEWLEVQDPAVLAKLRTLDVAQKPTDWATYTGGAVPTAPATASAMASASASA
jgi:hypothetical protein